MDTALVAGADGYATREEFITDAIRDKLLELTYEPAPPGPGEPALSPPEMSLVTDTRGDEPGPAPGVRTFDLTETVIRSPAPGYSMEGDVTVQDVPLFGLHNRDYTSLWALWKIGQLVAESPQSLTPTFEAVTEQAWQFAAQLRPLDAGAKQKLTALFPTNRAKAQSASGQFRAFAIGTVRESNGGFHGDGPLFVWRALQAQRGAEGMEVGLTRGGWELLASVDGVSLELPHGPGVAARFLEHLRANSSADFAALMFVLRGAGDRLTRPELIAAYQEMYPAWTEVQASTNAAGYVARGREWGLLETKLVDRRYGLTSDGELIVEKFRAATKEMA